ncbi:MAG: gamma-glutamyl-gamma-aminobutyrate hydrolase family protein [Isosphaeraceae bacterium]
MNHRPLIGINTDFRVSPKTKVACSLTPSGYYDCLLTANALPVMIPPLIRESELLPILEQLDGVC